MKQLEKSYEIDLTEKQLLFMVRCIEQAQSTHSIHPDAEERQVIRELSQRADEIEDKRYSDYDLRR